MNTFYIFGDSYFDDTYYYIDRSQTEKTWIELLKEKYSKKYFFKNYAKSGTGPHHSFNIFNKLLFEKNKIKEKDIILFHISGTDRISFICPEEIETHVTTNIKYDFIKKETYCTVDEYDKLELTEELIKTKKFYDNFRSEINFLFMNMENEIDYNGPKCMSFLYAVSVLYDVRVILFASDVRGKFNNFSKLNNKNFFASDFNLFDLSFDEIFDIEKNNVAGKLKFDNRNNHFSKENHILMLEYIEKIIERESVEFFKFKRNFKKSDEIFNVVLGEKRSSKKDNTEFIYE